MRNNIDKEILQELIGKKFPVENFETEIGKNYEKKKFCKTVVFEYARYSQG